MLELQCKLILRNTFWFVICERLCFSTEENFSTFSFTYRMNLAAVGDLHALLQVLEKNLASAQELEVGWTHDHFQVAFQIQRFAGCKGSSVHFPSPTEPFHTRDQVAQSCSHHSILLPPPELSQWQTKLCKATSYLRVSFPSTKAKHAENC